MRKRMLQFVSGAMVVSALLLSGCEKDKKDNAPQLPPLSAFNITVDEFEANAKSTGTHDNFLRAGSAVIYCNSILFANLAVPVACYAEAFNHEAQRVDNTTWKWGYTVESDEAVYTAELFAEVIRDSVYVEMHVSKEGGFQDFVWFTGKFDIVRSAGEWTVQTDPVSNVSWVKIEWNHDWESKTFDIRYTNIYTESEYEGSYIEYGITDDPVFDLYYLISDSKNLAEYEIYMNSTSHNGEVNQNGVKYCWDINYIDIVCPQLQVTLIVLRSGFRAESGFFYSAIYLLKPGVT